MNQINRKLNQEQIQKMRKCTFFDCCVASHDYFMIMFTEENDGDIWENTAPVTLFSYEYKGYAVWKKDTWVFPMLILQRKIS